jgi:hypothetical protein
MHPILMCTCTDHATGPCNWPANLPAPAVSPKVWRYLVLVSPSCALHRRNKFGRSAASHLSSSAIVAVQPSNFVQFCFLLAAKASSNHGFFGMACSPKIAENYRNLACSSELGLHVTINKSTCWVNEIRGVDCGKLQKKSGTSRFPGSINSLSYLRI